MNNLATINKDSKLALNKARNLMNITKKILAKKKTNNLVDDSWIERLWEWADENNISNDNLPRNKEKLLNLTKISFLFNQLIELPKEIGKLVNLTWLNLYDYPHLLLTQKQKEWIRELRNNGCEVYDKIRPTVNINDEIPF
jgi:Leucine-rich repeat (LRR) protein